ncbi:hypothetical protein BFJ63_vAg7963 [Fusarium oxysporum f. sp. narcissi]|uniref:Uncharacterized protein n=3 Tax=Fusarium oxysporum TaxID=5507 RepID=A0A420R717_FUSOX|nr:hypothetical protein BFJ65_g2002 [Fusarium oxysporum f. sp. cepae]RKK87841.1 hypothetical protein BFJ71_g13244 [Fusarium oxysporum]RYC89191.1 hypothetical protein BFJ63_vAg7963 [Fusarium oxysporum f. sp. narcissi]RKK35473.1 hypothetical protein BFJ67_g13267 [Fusarium oxysporum f. sp. cepae]RKK37476.1 hypothetical protein BFJ66_g12947 [Fusarium oxysporum f. sp. cepae]
MPSAHLGALTILGQFKLDLRNSNVPSTLAELVNAHNIPPTSPL